jgi:gamma-glutamyltranspeptidase/glutathione hydrolase
MDNTDNLKALPWRAVVNPAVHFARNGFPGLASREVKKNRSADRKTVTQDLVRYMREAMYWANESFLIEDPDFAIDFAPNGRLTRACWKTC